MSDAKQLIFVCTGNTCRSPMAEYLMRHHLGVESPISVGSAGVFAAGGEPISQQSAEALAEQGIDGGAHFSRPLTHEMLHEADLIVTMTEGHRHTILQASPEAADRVFRLKSFGQDDPQGDVGDPIGAPLAVYRAVRDEIDSALADLILYLRDQPDWVVEPPSHPSSSPMKNMKIAIAADHGGLDTKTRIASLLRKHDLDVVDLGTHDADSVDYPDYAAKVAGMVSDGEVDQGVLVCTTGIGMSIAANKVPRVRAALVTNPEFARLARSHNNANVLALPGDLEKETLEDIVNNWLSVDFEAGRHQRRIGKIDQIARTQNDPIAVAEIDPEVYAALKKENRRQVRNIELIASENYASSAVRACGGSLMTNKYAEGYPGKRWYNGCEHVDTVEQLAIDRACALFGAEHANVQAHSGSTANQAVYFSLLEPGDTVLSMSLAHGGHLTHGMQLNFSGRFFDIVHYGVNPDTEQIDYDEVKRLAEEHKPKMILCGASAYSRIIDFKKFREIADDVGAYLVADMAHIAGLVAAGFHPNPMPYCEVVTTTTHKTLRGPRGGLILCQERFAKDIDKQIFPGVQGGPLMHTIAAKAVCLHEAMQPAFKTYQEQVIRNAQTLAHEMEGGGLRIVSGGTDNHVMLVDLTPIDITGKDAATWLDRASITVNKNAIPFDEKSPFVTSGIRIGSPAVTTRGMQEAEMKRIADWIVELLKVRGAEEATERTRSEVFALTAEFPVP